MLKKLWLAPITVTVSLGVVSPGCKYRASSKKCTPWRSDTSPSQYGSMTAIGIWLTVTRVKSTGARGSTASRPYGVVR